ncbi:hypothetical protein GGF31_008346 [Allomyces arbusculus]|nr:hypothetical protein GGF31_008346 [Allomyces arbusculus]
MDGYSERITAQRVAVTFDDPALANLSPAERVILSSNGTLQRILSAFYNAPIDVVVVKNLAKQKEGTKDTWVVDREIHLMCQGERLGVAVSQLVITKREYFDLLITKSVGLGQFFKLQFVQPAFVLTEVRKTDCELYRLYELSCPGVVCTIGETFPTWVVDTDRPAMLAKKPRPPTPL